MHDTVMGLGKRPPIMIQKTCMKFQVNTFSNFKDARKTLTRNFLTSQRAISQSKVMSELWVLISDLQL